MSIHMVLQNINDLLHFIVGITRFGSIMTTGELLSCPQSPRGNEPTSLCSHLQIAIVVFHNTGFTKISMRL